LILDIKRKTLLTVSLATFKAILKLLLLTESTTDILFSVTEISKQFLKKKELSLRSIMRIFNALTHWLLQLYHNSLSLMQDEILKSLTLNS